MRIARYRSRDETRTGIVVDHGVVDVKALDDAAPEEVAGLLSEDWAHLEARAQATAGTPLDGVELLAPISRPSKFLAIGLNSRDHMEEALAAPKAPHVLEIMRQHEHLTAAFPTPRFPLVFNKQTTSIVGPGHPIWIPRDSDEVDYEGEAVIVIGRRVRRADEATAAAAIGGWTVTNDVSVRDWQWNTSQVWLGKSFDTHGPIGPWVVTADAFDPNEAVIRTWVNGEQRQNGRLTDQIVSPARMVSLISQVCTLEPGDLIATGSPAGTGTIDQNYLKAGDIVRVEVTGIGTIENEVVTEPAFDDVAVGANTHVAEP